MVWERISSCGCLHCVRYVCVGSSYLHACTILIPFLTPICRTPRVLTSFILSIFDHSLFFFSLIHSLVLLFVSLHNNSSTINRHVALVLVLVLVLVSAWFTPTHLSSNQHGYDMIVMLMLTLMLMPLDDEKKSQSIRRDDIDCSVVSRSIWL